MSTVATAEEADAFYLAADEPEVAPPVVRHRCGWGGTPRCGKFSTGRWLCDHHRARILVAAIRARVNPKLDDRYREWVREFDPAVADELDAIAETPPPTVTRNGITSRPKPEAKPKPAETYRERVARVAAERRAAMATTITEHVRERGGPVARRAMADLLGDASASTVVNDAIKLAVERDGLYTPGTVGPQALWGLWESESAHKAALAVVEG